MVFCNKKVWGGLLLDLMFQCDRTETHQPEKQLQPSHQQACYRPSHVHHRISRPAAGHLMFTISRYSAVEQHGAAETQVFKLALNPEIIKTGKCSSSRGVARFETLSLLGLCGWDTRRGDGPQWHNSSRAGDELSCSCCGTGGQGSWKNNYIGLPDSIPSCPWLW